MLRKAGIERGAVDGGDFISALQQLRGHAAGAGPKLQPMRALLGQAAVHGEEMQPLGDLRAGAADGVFRILGDEFRPSRMQPARIGRGGHSAEKPFLADKAEQGFLRRILLLGGFRRALRQLENLQSPTAEIRRERLVILLRRTRIEPPHKQRLRLAALEFVVNRLRCLLNKALHLLRVARPGVLHRDVPADETRGGRVPDQLRVFHLEKEIFGAKFPHLLRTKQPEDLRDETREHFGNADEVGGHGEVISERWESKVPEPPRRQARQVRAPKRDSSFEV